MGRRYPRLALVVAVLLLALAALPVLAQEQTGDLYGTVSDEQKQPLPGVTVTLSGVGAPLVQQSDGQGRFRFLNLYPGVYALKAELEGFSTVERPALTIQLGGKVNLEVTLTGAVKDVITVTGESPLLDERKIDQGANISTLALDKVPTARDPWSLLSQAPGVLVDRVNVGGNESGQQSNFIGVGSNARDNTFTVDGVVLTDMNAVGGSATYFDFGAFEEVQFTVSSADVTVQTSGVTINQVTKRGTNDWRGNARYLDTDGGLQAKPQLADGNRIDKVEEYGADIGGPLLKDHLWIWGAYGVSDIRNIVQGGQLDKTKLEDYNAKLNFQTGQNNSGVLHYWTNNKLKFGRDAGPSVAPGATHDQTTPQDIYKGEDTLLGTSNWSLTGLWSRDTGRFTLTPEGGLRAQRHHRRQRRPPGYRLLLRAERHDRPGAAGHQLLLQHRFRRPRAEVRRQLPRAGERLRHRLAARRPGHLGRAGRFGRRPGAGRVPPQPEEQDHLGLRGGLGAGHDLAQPRDRQRRRALRPPVHEEPGELRPRQS